MNKYNVIIGSFGNCTIEICVFTWEFLGTGEVDI